jgi:hypothetical protein
MYTFQTIAAAPNQEIKEWLQECAFDLNIQPDALIEESGGVLHLLERPSDISLISVPEGVKLVDLPTEPDYWGRITENYFVLAFFDNDAGGDRYIVPSNLCYDVEQLLRNVK